MGDAGFTPDELANLQPGQETESIREIHVLVTGFGAFNTFTINPSWLIASALPTTLEALPPSSTDSQAQIKTQAPARNSLAALLTPTPQPPALPLRPPNSTPYRIRVHTDPSPLRVAYASTATMIPSLLDARTNPERLSYDYILHIGLASGRDSYTLETQAYRDHYVIPDVDGAPGYLPGEKMWRSLGVPERLDVGWESGDVLRRWVSEVGRQQPPTQPDTITPEARQFSANHGILNIRGSSISRQQQTPRKAVVKLSRDAGRFLCEFVLMSSLAYRWRESANHQDDAVAREKVGKVAFLHVPNGIEPADVSRGVMVAESAIRSIVASWEAGYRNPLVYAPLATAATTSAAEKQQSVNEAGFETKGTGDTMPVAGS